MSIAVVRIVALETEIAVRSLSSSQSFSQGSRGIRATISNGHDGEYRGQILVPGWREREIENRALLLSRGTDYLAVIDVA